MTEDPLKEIDEANLRRLSALAHAFRATGNVRVAEGVSRRGDEGIGIEFREFRRYETGDDVRRIDWRTTLRRDRPYVRTFDNESTATWYICLDASASMSRPDPQRWKLANQIAAAVAYILLDSGNRVGLVAFAEEVAAFCPNTTGRQQYIRMRNALSELVQRELHGPAVLAVAHACVPHTADVILISDFLTEDAMVSDLHRLRRRGRRIHAIRIESEGDARADVGAEHVQLIDVESGERLIVPGHANELAKVRLDHLGEHLRSYCARSGIRLSVCDSTTPWRNAIVRHARGCRA